MNGKKVIDGVLTRLFTEAEIEQYLQSMKDDFDFMHPDIRKKAEIFIEYATMMMNELSYTWGEAFQLIGSGGRVKPPPNRPVMLSI